MLRDLLSTKLQSSWYNQAQHRLTFTHNPYFRLQPRCWALSPGQLSCFPGSIQHLPILAQEESVALSNLLFSPLLLFLLSPVTFFASALGQTDPPRSPASSSAGSPCHERSAASNARSTKRSGSSLIKNHQQNSHVSVSAVSDYSDIEFKALQCSTLCTAFLRSHFWPRRCCFIFNSLKGTTHTLSCKNLFWRKVSVPWGSAMGHLPRVSDSCLCLKVKFHTNKCGSPSYWYLDFKNISCTTLYPHPCLSVWNTSLVSCCITPMLQIYILPVNFILPVWTGHCSPLLVETLPCVLQLESCSPMADEGILLLWPSV